MEQKKYYVASSGNDDQAYLKAILFAGELAVNDKDIKRIVLFCHTKETTVWFERLFGEKKVKKLFSGIDFNGIPVPVQIETKKTYDKQKYHSPSDIVICCAIDSKDLFTIDDYSITKYMIVNPWQKDGTDKWIRA